MADGPIETATPRLLVVDDDDVVRRSVVRALKRSTQCVVDEAANAGEAEEHLLETRYQVVITDLGLPDRDGLSLMRSAREKGIDSCWIVLTGLGSFDSAVEALQLGAFDFISKPVSTASLRNTVGNALEQDRLKQERDRLTSELAKSNSQLREHVDQLEEACRLLRENAQTMQADLVRAGLIQQALLPRTAPALPDARVHAVYRPSQNVGGDLYDVVRVDERRLALLIADAAGHGLSAAMLAVLFRNQLPLVNPETREVNRPCEALTAVNHFLCGSSSAPGLFVTAACALLDLETRRLSIASAGHTPLILRRAGGEIERLFHTGPALGLYADAQYAQQEAQLESGDRLLFHTDGLYEHLLANGEVSPSETIALAFGREQGSPEAILNHLMDDKGVPAADAHGRHDDTTLLLLDIEPGESTLDNGVLRPIPASGEPSRQSGGEILIGNDDQRTTLSIKGRGDWIRSAAFHQACLAALEARRNVMVDMTLCEHLDSTFLGTIHDLCEQADRENLEFRLEGVMPPVEDLFNELGMRRVIDHLVPAMLPLPTHMVALVDPEEDPRSRAQRLLRAHQGLADLNERNRNEFDPLLQALRREVESL